MAKGRRGNGEWGEAAAFAIRKPEAMGNGEKQAIRHPAFAFRDTAFAIRHSEGVPDGVAADFDGPSSRALPFSPLQRACLLLGHRLSGGITQIFQHFFLLCLQARFNGLLVVTA